jgi:hypothetical protein
MLIGMLRRDNLEALRLVKDIDTTGNASLLYEVADVKTWANLGQQQQSVSLGTDP